MIFAVQPRTAKIDDSEKIHQKEEKVNIDMTASKILICVSDIWRKAASYKAEKLESFNFDNPVTCLLIPFDKRDESWFSTRMELCLCKKKIKVVNAREFHIRRSLQEPKCVQNIISAYDKYHLELIYSGRSSYKSIGDCSVSLLLRYIVESREKCTWSQ